jgi:hypothetical protein
VALKRVSDLSEIQRSIRRYSGISSFALSVAGGLPIFLFLTLQGVDVLERAAIAAATAVVTAWLFLRVDAWCHEQVPCPTCEESLFTRFFLEVQFGFWSWVRGIPEVCPSCGASLAKDR